MVAEILFDPWVTYIKPRTDPKIRLFCFPYAGGGASIFYSWPNFLPPEIEVCGIQLPGRESRIREPLMTQLMPIVEQIGRALMHHLDRPFAFFGHSMGALLGFEVARYLSKQQAPCPVHLFFSAHTAPHVLQRTSSIYELPEKDFLKALYTIGGTPKEVLDNKELMDIMLPILRADFTICETYTYIEDEPLNSSVTVFGGIGDKMVSYEDLVAWRKQTSGNFNIHMLPGNHFFLCSSQTMLLSLLQFNLQEVKFEKL